MQCWSQSVNLCSQCSAEVSQCCVAVSQSSAGVMQCGMLESVCVMLESVSTVLKSVSAVLQSVCCQQCSDCRHTPVASTLSLHPGAQLIHCYVSISLQSQYFKFLFTFLFSCLFWIGGPEALEQNYSFAQKIHNGSVGPNLNTGSSSGARDYF